MSLCAPSYLALDAAPMATACKDVALWQGGREGPGWGADGADNSHQHSGEIIFYMKNTAGFLFKQWIENMWSFAGYNIFIIIAII